MTRVKHGSAIMLTTGDQWLLAERSALVDNPLVWALPGGGVPRDCRGRHMPELPSACREFWEEMGAVVPPEAHLRGRVVWKGQTTRKRKPKQFTTYVLHVDPSARQMQFAPNYETGLYGWVAPRDVPRLTLHPAFASIVPRLLPLGVFPPGPPPRQTPEVHALLAGSVSVGDQREIEAWFGWSEVR